MVKRKRTGNEAAESSKEESSSGSSSAIKSVLSAEDGAFPRGGGSVLSPLEIKQAANEATKDVLFGNNKEDQTKKKKKRSKGSSTKTTTSTTDVKQRVKIEGLSFHKLIKGTVVLGQVSQVNTLDIALSLPNNLTGYVPITNISPRFSELLKKASDDSEEEDGSDEEEEKEEGDVPELSKMYRVGQWLRAVVEESGDSTKKRIELTIDPSVVNEKIDVEDLEPGMTVQTSVKSVEDHGVIMDVGSSQRSGFISKKELHHSGIVSDDLVEGQVMFLTVLSKSANGKTLTLTASPLAKKVPQLSRLNSSESLIAGVLVEAEVKEIRSHGIVTSVFEFANGTVDILHSGVLDGTELSAKFKDGDKIKARVTSTFPAAGEDKDRVALSVLPHVIGLTQAKTDALTAHPVGQIVNAKIQHVDSTMGLFVSIGDKKNPATGYVHISRISSEERIENLSAKDGDYAVNTTHKARVLGFANTDGLYIMSMERNVLEQPFLRVEDVPVGELISGTVDSILPKGGIVIRLADGITGLVNELNISDIKLAHPEKKYKPKKQVKARVLNVDMSKRRIYLTLKNSLINTEDPILRSYSDAKVGMKTPGYILAFKQRGAIVQFFGGVKGFLPVSEMSEAFIKDPKEHFTLGQSVSVRITSVDEEEQRLLVSCRTASTQDIQKELDQMIPGKSIVSASIVEKTKTGAIVDIEPYSIRGVLPIGQLADEKQSSCRSIFKKMKVGEKVENLVVLEKDKSQKFVTLSAKESLVNDAKAGVLPSELSEVQPDAQLHGYVKNATIKGVFIAFANNLTGLALKKDLSETEVIEDPAEKFEQFQSIECTVVNVDRVQGRFQLSLKKSTAPKPAEGQEALNPVDDSIKSLSQFVPGLSTKAKVRSVKETQVNVQLADNQQGRIDVSQMYEEWDDIKDRKHPLKGQFKKGDVIPIKIIGYHDARNHKFLPISHRSSTHLTLECSAKPSVVKSNTPYAGISFEDTKVGTTWTGFVNNHTQDFVWVNLSPAVRGRISMLDLSDDVDAIGNVEESFPIGSAIRCTVVENGNNVLRLSSREAEGTAINTIDDVKVDSVIPALVSKTTAQSVVVRLNSVGKVFASAYLTDIADTYKDEGSMTEEYVAHELVKCKVTSVDSSNKKVHVSLRDSECGDESEVTDKAIYGVGDVSAGDVVRGFVKNVADSGLFVALGRDVTARVQIKNLSDAFLTDWKKYFTVNEVVKGKIISVNNGKIDMTLKESVITGKKADAEAIGLEDLEEGAIMDGVVKRIEDFGVFVRIEGTKNVSGLCHRSQVADVPLNDLTKVFSEGDRVKVKVLSVDKEKKRLSLGMKASYFGDDSDVEMDSEDDDEEDGDAVLLDAGEDDSEEEEEEESSGSENEEMGEPATTAQGGLSANFDWTTSILDQTKKDQDSDSGEDDDSDDEEEAPRKRRKKAKTAVEDKTASLSTKLPQSVADYERLLVGSPNSSILWMNFMAFQLQLSEVDKAREIGDRALKTINFREEDEKFNIWVALLNLENSFGTDESLEETFKRALQFCDPKTVYLKLLNIYIQSNKMDKAERLYYTAAKKFGAEDLNIYVNFARFLFDQEKPEDARDILNRALQALSKNQHREVISKFAQIEFEKGDAERGRTLFEGLISSYPKRVDLWNIYIDQEIKHVNDKSKVKDLFERVFNNDKLRLTMKRAKFFFKKWLGYEQKHGDDKAINHVKAKAAAYVKNNS